MTEAAQKILIVEDDLDVAEMLNAYFRVQGYEVINRQLGGRWHPLMPGIQAGCGHPGYPLAGYRRV